MPDIWAPEACHVFTGLPGYRDPAMMLGCRAAYPQPRSVEMMTWQTEQTPDPIRTTDLPLMGSD